MKINVNAELSGQEVSELLLAEIYKQVINVENGVVKCIVINKKEEPVEVGLDKVKFVFNK